MNRACCCLVAAAGLVAAACAADVPVRPNILLIFADDLGLDGVGCFGSDRFRGKTPSLDRLAETGMKFTHCFAMPLCGPSRCALITGRYGFRTGGHTNPSAVNPKSADEPSFAKTLRAAGYVTGMAGKWRQMGETPGDWGFDEWLTDPVAGGWFWVKSYTVNGETRTFDHEIYGPDACLEFTLDFLRRHRDRPFLFYYSTHLIHGPIVRTPDSRPETKDFYEDMMIYLDKKVGRLLEELDRLGLRENTLILFTADNGTARFGAGHSLLNGRRIDGQKGSMLEGSARVPLIVNWKGVAPAGRTCDDLVDLTDFFPTFAELAGAKIPVNTVLDGGSFAPQIKGERGQPREWVFVQLGDRWYVRSARWKLTESGELFDMSDAPFSQKAVAPGEGGAEAAEARHRLQAILDQLNPRSGASERVPRRRKAARANRPRRR